MKKDLLFYNQMSPKHYLRVLLDNYPFDIDAAMVYSLCTKQPYPHPVLCSFVSYYKEFVKIRMLSSSQDSSLSLLPLFSKMSKLSQLDSGLLRSDLFNFQAKFFLGKHPFSHPYAHLPLQKIWCIDRIELHDKIRLSMSPYVELPIQKSASFIYRDISIDALDYVSISIQITHKHGMIFLSKQCASLAIPLFRMFHTTTPSVHQDFLLIFGLKDHENCMEYYVDETNGMYIGLARGNECLHHFLHVKHMILALYNALCIHQHDLPIHASMIEFFYHENQYGFMFLGEPASGKSELLDACSAQLKQQDIHFQALFDDFGTLHYLDNEMVTTAIEIGACKALDESAFPIVLPNFYEGMFLEEEPSKYYIVLPLTSFEETIHFHRVTHIFFLDNKKKGALQDPIDTIDSIDRTLFYQSYGCVQEQSYIHDLIEEFIPLFFVSNIPIYPLYTRVTPFHRQALFKKLISEILHKILG